MNIASSLAEIARERPEQDAVVEQHASRGGQYRYDSITFAQLEESSSALAQGMREAGLTPGTRIALLVKPGIDFVTLVFALFKAGAVIVLIDPGMGRRRLIGCLEQVSPAGFVGGRLVQTIRAFLRRRFPEAKLNFTVESNQGGTTRLRELAAAQGDGPASGAAANECDANGVCPRAAEDEAAIIFTTGSTGPPKGVRYTHGNFGEQVRQIGAAYAIEPGEIDLACFPLFGLFNAAMGVTTVVPDMDATRPAHVDPRRIVAAIGDRGVTQSFASPALWNVVGGHCQTYGLQLGSLRRVMSAGVPVAPRVLEQMQAALAEGGEMHTPYGATEALPVATIAAREVLGETASATRAGRGTCVGRRFASIAWKVLPLVDRPLVADDLEHALPAGEVGELVVSGPQVTQRYATDERANAWAKLQVGDCVWHRMGDLGYLDEAERFWFCGRVAHKVTTAAGPMYPVCCEAMLNTHARVHRTALVGAGPPGAQRPVVFVEPLPGQWPLAPAARRRFAEELREVALSNPLTASIEDFRFLRALPVDIRHNAKIFREQLAAKLK